VAQLERQIYAHEQWYPLEAQKIQLSVKGSQKKIEEVLKGDERYGVSRRAALARHRGGISTTGSTSLKTAHDSPVGSTPRLGGPAPERRSFGEQNCVPAFPRQFERLVRQQQ